MKPMRYIKFLLPIVAIMAVVACSKKININDEWQDVTVVYGILDQNDTIHYIKINKAFLGEADAYGMAGVKDSSEYEVGEVEAVVEQYTNGTLVKSYTLIETTLSNKDEGIFYGPEQKVYMFEEANLNPESTYRLVANIGDKQVTAETKLINKKYSVIRWGGAGNGNLVELEFIDIAKNLKESIKFEAFPSENAKRIEIYFHFIYTEIRMENGVQVSELDSFIYKLEEESLFSDAGDESLDVKILPESFYRRVGQLIDVADENIVKRQVEDCRVVAFLAGEALDTYIEVTKPSLGLVQDKKEFTNVDGGIGIFSCRTSEVWNVKLDNNSVEELIKGEATSELADDGVGYTVGRKFCSIYVDVFNCLSCETSSPNGPCW